MKNVICVIGALMDETSGIRKKMVIHKTFSLDGRKAFLGIWHHNHILLMHSGVGRHHAQPILEKACKRFPVSSIISIGFAGGLTSDLQLGDLVIADTVYEVGMNTELIDLKGADPLTVDSVWVEQALKLSFLEDLPRRRGGLVTSDKPICNPEEKKRLGRDFLALAVDMESSVLLRVALKMKIPFLSIRAISDTAEQELINFSNYVNSSGQLSKTKAGWYILTHPGLIPKVEKLRKGSQKARSNLTRFLDKWIYNYPEIFS